MMSKDTLYKEVSFMLHLKFMIKTNWRSITKLLSLEIFYFSLEILPTLTIIFLYIYNFLFIENY